MIHPNRPEFPYCDHTEDITVSFAILSRGTWEGIEFKL